jgi:acetyl-CoA carboxylase biotin carboxyl carrier protein
MEMKEIESVVKIFEKSSLSEMILREKDFSLVLRRRGVETAAIRPSAAPSPPNKAATAERDVRTAEAASGTEIITSPIVGTFYRSPAPDSPPFVQTGTVIRKGKPLCILEAMKAMNQFEAEFDCEIVKILAENGSLVQFGTPLFEVRRA